MVSGVGRTAMWVTGVFSVLATMLLGIAVAMMARFGHPGIVLLGATGAIVMLVCAAALGFIPVVSRRIGGPSTSQQRRAVIILLAAAALSAAAIIVYGMLANAPFWLPASVIALGVLTAAIASLSGSRVARTMRRPTVADWRAYPRPDRVRDVRRIVLASVLTSTCTAVVLTVVFVATDTTEWAFLVVVSVGLGLLAGGIAAGLVATRHWRSARAAANGDIARSRMFGDVVFRGSRHDLGVEDRASALRFAQSAIPAQTFQLVAFTMYIGWLVMLQVNTLMQSSSGSTIGRALGVGGAVVAAVVFAVGLPVQVRRLIRARRWVSDIVRDSVGRLRVGDVREGSDAVD